MNILLIGGQPDLSSSIADYLAADGHVFEMVGTLRGGYHKAGVFGYGCILVDIGLPNGSGLKMIKKLKPKHKRAGIFISARNNLSDRIDGLDPGVYGYLTKSFHLAKLNARLRTVHPWKIFGGGTLIEFGDIIVDPVE
ncbi:response regulator transcription factor [Lewinella sp. JB7]|uniref:response regulator transcription factor n=1 Tax=Lewinella sp. JB7 TaxID=2962887 RepID=UPI0020C9D97F|nr:response regulator [Lewinella sp. JB7]MCP9234738.1 response regulator [Lewinella sp. JB7]